MDGAVGDTDCKFVIFPDIAHRFHEFALVGFGDGVSPREDSEGVEGFHLGGGLRKAGPFRVHTVGHRMVEPDGGAVEPHAFPPGLFRDVASHPLGQLVDLQPLLVHERVEAAKDVAGLQVLKTGPFAVEPVLEQGPHVVAESKDAV